MQLKVDFVKVIENATYLSQYQDRKFNCCLDNQWFQTLIDFREIV